MSSLVEVRLWGRTIGSIHCPPGQQYAFFQYAPEFVASGIEVSPLMMPLSHQVYAFPELAFPTFHGLPGLVADSLPDRFGNAVIDAWLSRQGREAASFSALERLCYTGTRGMGALEFFPLIENTAPDNQILDVAHLVSLASEVLRNRKEGFNDTFLHEGDDAEIKKIFQIGASAGGARAKAVIAWNPQTQEVRSGQVEAGSGFQYWLMKFDGVSGSGDKELADPQGFTNIEYAYSILAQKVGIHMSSCRLFSEGGRHHFMTQRFDRTQEGSKIHMQSLGALAHYDFNMAAAYSYEQAFSVLERLGCPMEQKEQLFLRMVFNIVMRNQDDHVKNISFLMDRKGTWSLAPAYDLTFSYQKGGQWTGRHQMSMNGKRDGFTRVDFMDCAATVGVMASHAKELLSRVQALCTQWLQVADEAGVDRRYSETIFKEFRVFKNHI